MQLFKFISEFHDRARRCSSSSQHQGPATINELHLIINSDFFLFLLHKPAHFCRTLWINILSSPSLFSLPAHRVPRNLEMNIILRLSFFVSRPEVQWFLRGPANGSNYQSCDLMKDASACWHVVYLCVTRNAYTIRIYPTAFFFSPGYSSLFFFYPEKKKTTGKHVYTAPSLRKNNEKII